MITELLQTGTKNLLLTIINLLPTMNSILIPDGIVTWLANIIGGVGYFLPIVDMLIMFNIYIGVVNFHIIWKFALRLWEALPFN
jgi:hypothetical protein